MAKFVPVAIFVAACCALAVGAASIQEAQEKRALGTQYPGDAGLLQEPSSDNINNDQKTSASYYGYGFYGPGHGFGFPGFGGYGIYPGFGGPGFFWRR